MEAVYMPRQKKNNKKSHIMTRLVLDKENIPNDYVLEKWAKGPTTVEPAICLVPSSTKFCSGIS